MQQISLRNYYFPVTVYGLNDSSGEYIHESLPLGQLYQFYKLLLAGLLTSGDCCGVKWDLYQISWEVFGDKEHYYLASVVLHTIDDGSDFGRVGFSNDAGSIAKVIAALVSLLYDLVSFSNYLTQYGPMLAMSIVTWSLHYANVTDASLTEPDGADGWIAERLNQIVE